jgi:hypothetical protein
MLSIDIIRNPFIKKNEWFLTSVYLETITSIKHSLIQHYEIQQNKSIEKQEKEM